MKILIADDDHVSVLYLRDALEEWGYEVTVASDGALAAEMLQQPDAPMLAIIDWMMPGMDGVDVCRTVRESVKDRYIYMIMLTSRSETEFIVQAMNAGADDFIAKPFHAGELQVRVRAGRRVIELEQELRRRATHDVLTGLVNRGAIMEVLQKELSRQKRAQHPVSVIFADLDRFKAINDTWGHLAGDDVLREAASRMGRTLRPYDTFGRYGGEEMLVVLPNCDMQGAVEVAERMRSAMEATPIATQAGDVPVTVSMGVATVNREIHLESVAELLHRADTALYRAKENGRNCIVVANDG